MSEFDQDQLVELLSDCQQAPPGSAEAIQQHGLLALVSGRAATVAEISRESGLTADDIRAGIDGLRRAGRIETSGEEVTGVGGLTLTATTHALELPAAALHTWCALDAVGIPVALGLDAQVSTTCPHCAATLSISVKDDSPIGDRSLRLFCPTGSCENLRAEFCSAANLFCSSAHLAAWRTENPAVDGHELELAAMAELGRAMWGRFRSQRSPGR
jgi:hypothetical protein